MSVVETSGTYDTGGGAVNLEVVVGNGHAGETDISFDGEVVASGSSRTSAELPAGPVEVDTVVNQTAKESMTLLVTYIFSGGPQGTRVFEASHEVTAKGQGADFFGGFTLT